MTWDDYFYQFLSVYHGSCVTFFPHAHACHGLMTMLPKGGGGSARLWNKNKPSLSSFFSQEARRHCSIIVLKLLCFPVQLLGQRTQPIHSEGTGRIFGFSVGIAGLAGLFSVCLDVINKVDPFKDFGVE